MFVFLFLYIFFSILCYLRFCFVLCIVSPFLYSFIFPIFIQVYRQQLSGGNSILVNKYMCMMEHTKCKTFGYKYAPYIECDRSDVTADNLAYLNAVRTVRHVLYRYPLTNTCALRRVYQITYCTPLRSFGVYRHHTQAVQSNSNYFATHQMILKYYTNYCTYIKFIKFTH